MPKLRHDKEEEWIPLVTKSNCRGTEMKRQSQPQTMAKAKVEPQLLLSVAVCISPPNKLSEGISIC